MAAPTPTVVLVPGFMQRGRSWSAVVDRLDERYPRRCLDLGGATWTERLTELRAAAPAGSVLVGYSMGGRLVLHAALGDPGRVAGVVTLGASPGIEDPGARAERRRADEELAGWMEGRRIEEVVARWERMPVFASQPPEMVAAQRADRLTHEPRALASLLRTGGQGALEPGWGRLGELGVPLLALAGAGDGPYAEAAARMAALAPRGEAAFVPGAGHAAHLEHPAAVAGLLEAWLDGLNP